MIIINRAYVVLFQVVLFAVFLFSSASHANELKGFRIWPSSDNTKVVIDLQSEADFSYFTLSNPYRVVVDIKQTTSSATLPFIVKDSDVLSKIRSSSPSSDGSYRLVFELKRPSSPQISKLSPSGKYGYRIVADFPYSSSVGGSSTEASKSSSGSAKAGTISRDVSQFVGNDDILIAIDAGHGGDDPGSIGPSGRYEKTITLSVAKKLSSQLNAIPGFKAVLTRSGDYFVNLNQRSTIARKNKAHLLISIHADAFNSTVPRGASVFVLNTKRANTEISRWVEDHERQSELLGGAGQVLAKNNNDKNVSQTLLDLQFSHSQKEGYKLAKNLLVEIGKVAHLHKREPVNASLAVLKSPDIPSVLIETGFISNPREETLLFQSGHQDKLARAISKAVVTYFQANAPEGTYFANRNHLRKHKVGKGESLSAIASKYGSSTSDIMKANRLKSQSLRAGQVLVIPAASRAVVVPVIRNSVETESILHVVKSGEYLGSIASKYKVPVSDIKRENQLTSNVVFVGQTLKITASVKDQPLRTYKVQKGDYLSKVAANFAVSVESIREANQLKSDNIMVGQSLIIPHK
jgi:N-acetylmuramoyl-L-alanine amidase